MNQVKNSKLKLLNSIQNLSTAVNMFLAQTVINNSWLLDKSSLIPDNIDEARNDVLHNHNLTQFNSVKELEDYISKD